MPTWPATLPSRPEAEGYSELPRNQVVESQNDLGPAKTRLRTTAKQYTISLQYKLSLSQAEDFEDFFDNTILFGTVLFDWDNPRRNVTQTVRLVGEPPYSLTPIGSGFYWLLKVTFEVQP